MNVKTKLILSYPKISYRNHRSRKLGKKIQKFDDREKYPLLWRNNWVLGKAKKLSKTLKIELTVKGFENLPKGGAILVPNHTSSFDPAVIMMALENPSKTSSDINKSCIFLAKDDIKKNKKVKGYAMITNAFFIDRANARRSLKEIDKFGKFIKKEKTYGIIFAEGTRSKDGNIQEFKGGAFRIAKKDFLPIVPVTINNAFGITNFSRKNKIQVEVVFSKPIKPMSIMAMDTKAIAAKVQKQVSKNWVAPKDKADLSYEKKVA
ncbi:MAG: 1-acyl-sn-glycerol-3-phosphate acyltransferase [Mycoplasmataceae bacterium]|nr:1-acyl-sn-glycerol-3-phosphate acyltransferase [Mycoplasmataceae bacterium]